jgi:hypothetical protein
MGKSVCVKEAKRWMSGMTTARGSMSVCENEHFQDTILAQEKSGLGVILPSVFL